MTIVKTALGNDITEINSSHVGKALFSWYDLLWIQLYLLRDLLGASCMYSQIVICSEKKEAVLTMTQLNMCGHIFCFIQYKVLFTDCLSFKKGRERERWTANLCFN